METLRLPKRVRSTIEEIASIALEHLPMTFSQSDFGPGRKVFFPIPLKKRPLAMIDYLYVYVESKLPDDPKNKDLGFTEEDIVDDAGIYIFKRNGRMVEGRVFPLETLLVDIITDLSLRSRIIYRVNEMKTMIHLDEEFIELANAERSANARPPKRLH